MRLGKLKQLLNLWIKNGLISEEHRDNIIVFTKEHRRLQLLRLVKWLFIIGAFWIFFGLMSALSLINPDFLKWIADFFMPLFRIVGDFLNTIYLLLERVLGPNAEYAVYAMVAFAVWGLFFWLAGRVSRRAKLLDLKLDYFAESSLRPAMTLYVMGYIAIGLAFSFLNRLLLPHSVYSYYYSESAKLIPIFYFAGTGFFLYCAYRLKDQIALLFSIYFIGLSLGCFSGYMHACYWLGVPRPMLQLLVALIMILIGFVHILSQNKEYQEYFGRTYQWTGLLLGFIALWIMSIWGIFKGEGYWSPNAGELWFSNILFIGSALGAMGYGAKSDDPLFFNYGLTFLIIATYTIFFSHIWENLGAAIGSLILGTLLVGTGFMLRKVWLKTHSRS